MRGRPPRSRGRGRGRGRGKKSMVPVPLHEEEIRAEVTEMHITSPTTEIDLEADISQLEPPTFSTIEKGPPEPMLRLLWNHKVRLMGEKVVNPMIHCCDTCLKPILIYGRMIPCKHVFCLTCGKKEDTANCPRCKEKVARVEQTGLGTVFMCTHGGSRYGNSGCRRTYLSQRDLQAHINHRHTPRGQLPPPEPLLPPVMSLHPPVAKAEGDPRSTVHPPSHHRRPPPPHVTTTDKVGYNTPIISRTNSNLITVPIQGGSPPPPTYHPPQQYPPSTTPYPMPPPNTVPVQSPYPPAGAPTQYPPSFPPTNQQPPFFTPPYPPPQHYPPQPPFQQPQWTPPVTQQQQPMYNNSRYM